jgi:hypothetical protein
MKRNRVALLGALLILMTLVGRGQAHATLQSCINICYQAEEICKLNCKGNTTCDSNCATTYSLCLEGCDR